MRFLYAFCEICLAVQKNYEQYTHFRPNKPDIKHTPNGNRLKLIHPEQFKPYYFLILHYVLTSCCNFLNSLGFVPGGTNCIGFSIRTAVECVGEPSATH